MHKGSSSFCNVSLGSAPPKRLKTTGIECYALPDQQAYTVADALVTQFFTRFGVPYFLHTDQGRDFESQLFQHVCDLLGIQKTRTSPYRPQSDGLVEGFNRTIQQMLVSYVNESSNDWDDHLPYLAWLTGSPSTNPQNFPQIN